MTGIKKSKKTVIINILTNKSVQFNFEVIIGEILKRENIFYISVFFHYPLMF